MSILRVPDQNGVFPLYIMLEIHHSGWEPSISTVNINHANQNNHMLEQANRMWKQSKFHPN